MKIQIISKMPSWKLLIINKKKITIFFGIIYSKYELVKIIQDQYSSTGLIDRVHLSIQQYIFYPIICTAIISTKNMVQ